MVRKCLLAAALLLLASTSRATNYTLTVSTLGPIGTGLVTSTNIATGIDCGSTNTACSATYLAGSTVTLTATWSSTMAFAGWGGTQGCTTNSLTCSVVMNAASVVSAKFVPLLSVSLYGNGIGTVADSSSTLSCSSTGPCASYGSVTQAYSSGTWITLTASTGTRSTFLGWTGAGCSGTGTCSFNLGNYKTVVATFTSAGPFSIAVSTQGTGTGVVTSTNPVTGINCGSTNTVCAVPFAANLSVTLTAIPSTGSSFAGWANAGCSGTGTCVVLSTSAWQGVGGSLSPAAYFYKTP